MLEISGLSKRFGDILALDGASLTVAPGRMLGFLGPNGAGKTTTMRAVFGLVRPDAGRVTWKGGPIDDDVRRRFGYMPEERGLYPRMRLADQVAYIGRLHGLTKHEAAQRTSALLDQLGLGKRADSTIESLSHGNQQRAQLAASLVHDPELLVLDEPFSGLDPVAVDVMAEVLRDRVAAGAAVVFSSHQLDLVEDLCDDVAIIHQGRVVVSGPLERLQDDADVRHVQLELEGELPRSLLDLEGVRQHRRSGVQHELLVDRGVGVDAVMAALEAARVRRLVFGPATLNDLFRAAVGEAPS